MEAGMYNRVRSHHDIVTLDSASEALASNTFIAPLPYVGNTLDALDQIPSASDRVCSMDTNFPQNYTSWNFQSRSVITSFCSWEGVVDARPAAETGGARAARVSILQDGALRQILNACTSFTPKQRYSLENQDMYLDSKGNILRSIPRNPTYRSAALTAAQVEEIIDFMEAPGASSSGSDEYEDSFTHITAETSAALSDTPPVEPAERSKISKIPCRMVKSMRASFQASSPTSPPKSAKCLALEAYAANSDKASTQPLLSTVRSPLARDLPSIQTLLSYMSLTNASHIDTIPALRGLCYAFAQPDATFRIDKIYNHFLRREVLSHQPTSAWYTYNRTANREHVNGICVTMPAFSAHMKGVDTLLMEDWPVSMMDQGWIAVPITSDMVGQRWLREYALCFLSSTIWAGNISRRSNHRHATEEVNGYKRTSFTTIPLSHNVYIPGPTSIMFVLIDENTTAANIRCPILIEGGLPIYKGSQYVPADVVNLNDYTINLTDVFYGALHDFNNSALQMCHALEWIETNLCVDMAFQLAFSLAAELCSSMPKCPFLEVANNNNRRYANPLNGAWTFGAHNFNEDSPRHTSSDMSGGLLANRPEKYTRCINGYNFAAVSPMLQYATSIVNVTNEAQIENNTVVGYRSYWTEAVPQVEAPQYQAHLAHSVYRVLTAIGMIEKNDYRFMLSDATGLQTVLVLQASALTLSMAVYMTRNDINRIVWSGLGSVQGTVARSSARGKIAQITAGHIIYPNVDALMSRAINAGRTCAQEIEYYYGTLPTDITWAASVCAPYFAVLQWAAKFNIDMFTIVPSGFGPITDDYQAAHIELRSIHRNALPWYASTGNSRSSLPRILLCRERHTPTFLPISVDDWATLTTGRLGPVTDNGMVSNTMSPSFRYHFRDQSNLDYVVILSRMTTAHYAQNAWAVEPALYPAPPPCGKDPDGTFPRISK